MTMKPADMKLAIPPWADLVALAVALVAVVLLLATTGCAKSRTEAETVKHDRISVSGTATVPTAEGPRAIPVSFTIDRRGTESTESETKSGLDGAAIGREIAASLGPLLGAASGGMPWAQLLGGIGGAGTLATTAYLALQKRQQMRQDAPRRTGSNSG